MLFPHTDPTPLFELFRGSYATELLTAAVCHFDIFHRLAVAPLPFETLRHDLRLEKRPANVLITALRAMKLLTTSGELLELTPLAAEHLVPGGRFDVGNYIGLAAQSPGVLSMVECLKSNRPLNFDTSAGTAFIYRDGQASAMEQAESARHFTLALAGRAMNVAPYLARNLPLNHARRVLDVAGGTGIYSLALLAAHPELTTVILDRPEVLRVAEELVREAHLESRVTLQQGDMFTDDLRQECDVILLSNVLHDWDEPECERLIDRCASALPPGGRLVIHDVFLNDDLDGPLPIALYSAALFTLTEGRAYSVREYSTWLTNAGLVLEPLVPTFVHCGALVGRKI